MAGDESVLATATALDCILVTTGQLTGLSSWWGSLDFWTFPMDTQCTLGYSKSG